MAKTKDVRERLERAQNQLLNNYLMEIRKSYGSVDLLGKQVIISGLESVLSQTTNQRNVVFDGNKARIIRKNLGLSMREVGEKLKFKSALSQISHYERGPTQPNPEGEHTRKYLLWLKENGYNPYHL